MRFWAFNTECEIRGRHSQDEPLHALIRAMVASMVTGGAQKEYGRGPINCQLVNGRRLNDRGTVTTAVGELEIGVWL